MVMYDEEKRRKQLVEACINQDIRLIKMRLAEMALRHNKYWHYTEHADEILNSEQLWLSAISEQNDNDESKKALLSNEFEYFSISFSHDLFENLEEWVLYANYGQGECLAFDSYIIRGIKEGLYDISLCECIGQKCNKIFELKKNDIRISDVIYTHDCDNGGTIVIYDNEKMCLSYGLTEPLSEEKGYFFVKNVIWHQEMETRIVAKVDKRRIPNIEKKNLKVVIDIGERMKSFQHILGPESSRQYENSKTLSGFTKKINLKRNN